MTDVAIKIARLLLPRDADKGAASLLERMTENPKFQRFALPSLNNTSKSSYDAWVKNPVMSSIKQAVTALGNTKRPLREQLLSLLSLNYPKSWLQEHFGVGRTTTMRAADHAEAFGPELCPDPGATHNITRDRRVGPKEEFIRIWMLRKENFEASPEIKRDRTGVLVQRPTTYRVLNQNRGYEKYTADAMKEGYPHYSRSHFYLRNAEMGLIDSKSEAGSVLIATYMAKKTGTASANVLSTSTV
jgi:hypothetical protein